MNSQAAKRTGTEVINRKERTLKGMRKAAAKGRLPGRPLTVSDAAIWAAIPLGTLAGARKVGLSKTQFIARRRKLEERE